MGLFSSYGKRKKSPAQRAARLEAKIKAKEKKLKAKQRLAAAQKKWDTIRGK